MMNMIYRRCGRSGIELPVISLGLWHNFGSVDNFNVATDMIKYAFDHGVTHLTWQIITVLLPEVPK